MFNNGFKKESLERLEKSKDKNEIQNKLLMAKAELLFGKRQELKLVIDKTYDYINSMRNKPQEYETKVEKIRFEIVRYESLLKVVKDEVKSAEKNIASKGSAAAGAALGAGVAAFGPSAAMGIAMTFGTASTGTAISALSGAAATNAALAWLGGGALTIGGTGMAGGSALLALAGPIGWAIGGIGLTAAGLLTNGKNKKVAEQANEVSLEIEANTKVLLGLSNEVDEIQTNIRIIKDELPILLGKCGSFGREYSTLTDDQRYILGTLVNNTTTAVQLLNKGIGEKV